MEDYKQAGVIAERGIDEPVFDQYGLKELLTKKGLIKSVTFGKYYSPSLVQEFYCNLFSKMKSPKASGYHQIHVRGKRWSSHQKSINDFLECPTGVENGLYVYDEDFEYSNEVVEALT